MIIGLLAGLGVCAATAVLAGSILWWVYVPARDRSFAFAVLPPIGLVFLIIIVTFGFTFRV